MDKLLRESLVAGVERVIAWSGLLDKINVFPLADGDTGRNLTISLSPLRGKYENREEIIDKLLLSACGNSGNIAAGFLSGFLESYSWENLPQTARSGRDKAFKAVRKPQHGTMLTVFDVLVDILEKVNKKEKGEVCVLVIDQLEKAVRDTSSQLPKLKAAGVVDAGALGMFLFLEVFFKHLSQGTYKLRPVFQIFEGMLEVSASFSEIKEESYCVDAVIRLNKNNDKSAALLSKYDDSLTVISNKDYLKVHLHTDDNKLKEKIESLGEVIRWTDDNMGDQIEDFNKNYIPQAIHIMTDAAGSVTRQVAKKLNITLLDSHIIIGEDIYPETLLSSSKLYTSMEKGIKVSTSQASIFERHQCYKSVLDQNKRVLYLCVGSLYTGNYDVVMDWKKGNDPHDNLIVIDTKAACGRLGTIVRAVASFSHKVDDYKKVVQFAEKAVENCEEYVFLEKLKYLAASGRVSRHKALFGDILNKKPVISHTVQGIEKAGVVKNREDQLKFAIKKLERSLPEDSKPLIMVEYSNNKNWVKDKVMKEVKSRFPFANIMLEPLSLTSGTHMGPGTWGVAFLL